MNRKPCAGCGHSRGAWRIDGAYWHVRCYRVASPEARKAAGVAMLQLSPKAPPQPPANTG